MLQELTDARVAREGMTAVPVGLRLDVNPASRGRAVPGL